MQSAADWWSQCAFVRDYFFGGQQKVAHQLAAYLAQNYVGQGITELRPETDVSALIGDSIRMYINSDEFTLAREEGPLADVDLKESFSFQDLVGLIHARHL